MKKGSLAYDPPLSNRGGKQTRTYCSKPAHGFALSFIDGGCKVMIATVPLSKSIIHLEFHKHIALIFF